MLASLLVWCWAPHQCCTCSHYRTWSWHSGRETGGFLPNRKYEIITLEEKGRCIFRFFGKITRANPSLPILTGNPGGNFKVTKSRRRAKWELVRAMRSIIGVTCSTRERGWSSLIHKVPLNLHDTTVTSTTRQINRMLTLFKLPLCYVQIVDVTSWH